jgi:hypothetical protein
MVGGMIVIDRSAFPFFCGEPSKMSFYSPRLLLGAALLAGMMCTTVLAQQAYPKDIADFVQVRDDCDDLRQNMSDTLPGNDAAIRNAIADTKDQCRGTDKTLDALKKEYAADPDVMQKLNSYAVQTERDPS